MIRQNDRNFAFAELADTAVTKNPITGKSYRDEALTDAEISFGNRYNPGNPVNFAQIINEDRYRLGGLLKLINHTGILPYNAEISYSVGAIVTKNQNIFTSLINGNINNSPESSPAAWESIVDFLADEFVRVDLSNVTTSGSGQTIVLQDGADLLNPTCTTQPAGTSNALAASTEFVQNAVASIPPAEYTPAMAGAVGTEGPVGDNPIKIQYENGGQCYNVIDAPTIGNERNTICGFTIVSNGTNFIDLYWGAFSAEYLAAKVGNTSYQGWPVEFSYPTPPAGFLQSASGGKFDVSHEPIDTTNFYGGKNNQPLTNVTLITGK